MSATGRLAQARILVQLRLLHRRMARVDALAPDERASWRDLRVRRLREHAVADSVWYRERHRGLDAAPLAELPVLTKSDVVDRFDDVVTDQRLSLDVLRQAVTDERPPRGTWIAASSGSSGRPGLFPFTTTEWVGLLANAARARAVSGPPTPRSSDHHRVRTARIGSPSPWHLSRQMPNTLRDPRRPSIDLSAATDTAELAEHLEAWKPDVLSGYPSAIAALAARQLAGDLDIGPVQVFTGGERLTPAFRDTIRSAWGVQPFDQYATAEVGFIGIECPAHDGFHVMENHVVVEVVDDDGTAVEPGEHGARVLVTALGSRTLPLVRYELGDVAVAADGACSCGRSTLRLRSVMGAGRDLLQLPGAHGGTLSVHPVAFTALLDVAPVRGWQVRIDADRITVLVVGPDGSFDPESTRRSVRQSLVEAAVGPVHVDVVEVGELPRSAGGKAGLVVADDGSG